MKVDWKFVFLQHYFPSATFVLVFFIVILQSFQNDRSGIRRKVASAVKELLEEMLFALEFGMSDIDKILDMKKMNGGKYNCKVHCGYRTNIDFNFRFLRGINKGF